MFLEDGKSGLGLLILGPILSLVLPSAVLLLLRGVVQILLAYLDIPKGHNVKRLLSTHSEPANELESDVDEIPILGKSDDEDSSVGATKEYETDPMPSSGDGDSEDEGLEELGQNEDMPELPESSIRSPDQEPGSTVSNEERIEEAKLATEDRLMRSQP
ncbi:hypothetical protein L1887_20949 [Cichorium endivia]|nr:hypothetical protein L1887_20949 [Cichorium endivia]